MEYYKYTTEEVANGAKEYICITAGTPYIHGDPEGRHGTTDCWDEVVEFTSGGFGFKRLPGALRGRYEGNESEFDTTYPAEIVDITDTLTEIVL